MPDSLDWLRILSCNKKELHDFFKAIRFLRFKLEYSREEVKNEYEKVKKNLIKKAEKEMARKLRIKPIENTDERRTEIRELPCSGIEGEDALFFHIDSLIIDIKREIEFSIKFFAESNGFTLDDFSLETTLQQLSSDYPNQRNGFMLYLLDKQKDYVSFIFSKIKWLNQLNTKRTTLIHYGILNKSDEYDVIFKWDIDENGASMPDINISNFGIFGRPVNSWIDYQVKELDEFIKKTFSLIKDVFDYQSTLKGKRFRKR